MSSPRYEVHPGDSVADREQVLETWATAGFSQDADENRGRYDWFHVRNPQGTSAQYFLSVEGEPAPAGVIAVACRRFHVNGRDVDAGVLVDFVVRPEHRSLLPALTLQRGSRAHAMTTRPVLFGIPNEKARAVFIRAGTDLRLDIGEHCRVLRFRKYLARYVPAAIAGLVAPLVDFVALLPARLQLLFAGERGEWTQSFGTEFDELWERAEKTARSIGVRDAAFLRWRFADHPSRSYRALTIRERRSGRLLGYFVCETVDDSLVVKDWLWAGTGRGLSRALLRLAVSGGKEGAHVIRLQTSPTPEILPALRSAHYVKRGTRLLVALLDGSVKEEVEETTWHITPADEDV